MRRNGDEKYCPSCKKTLHFTQFHRNKAQKDGRAHTCKHCRLSREYLHAECLNKKKYAIYYLPQHHYVGVSIQLFRRLKEHRKRHKRITSDYEILYQTDSLKEAVVFEATLHEMGYYGVGTYSSNRIPIYDEIIIYISNYVAENEKLPLARTLYREFPHISRHLVKGNKRIWMRRFLVANGNHYKSKKQKEKERKNRKEGE